MPLATWRCLHPVPNLALALTLTQTPTTIQHLHGGTGVPSWLR